MFDIEKEREAFENWFRTTEMYNVLIEYIATHQPGLKTVFIKSGKFYRNTMVNTSWVSWQASKQHEAQKLEGCVVVPKDQTEDWYLDPDENMWWEADGIDGTLCDLKIGEVAAIEHKEYLITVSDTLYAAIVWDNENQDTGTWEFFKTEEEAEQAAAHCKAMVEAARGGK